MNFSSDNNAAEGIAILGATGSIGRNAVAVAAAHPERFRVECLTCARDEKGLLEAAEQCRPADLYCAASPAVSTLKDEDEICRLLASDRVQLVVCAIQGISALRQVLAALRAGKKVALATKEVLVAAGEWVMGEAARNGGTILPVDSEHCAIFQCLKGGKQEEVRRIILSCSGGPFHARPEVDLHRVTPEEAMKHPTWNMGAKITLDSATLMNKAFEVMEAAWLYGMPESMIDVVIHPQSLIHSMVEFRDCSVLAQMGPTDMKLPIQYCMTYPERIPALTAPMDFTKCNRMEFSQPDDRRFPAIELARRALRQGGLAGAVFNAANDAACALFKNGKLAFDEIAAAVEFALEHTPPGKADSFESLALADEAAVGAVTRFAEEFHRP